jgi:hypothetical protein
MNTYILIDNQGNRREVPFLMRGGREYVSEHISRSEFAEKASGKLIIFEPLIDLFESVRATVGLPIVINSGYRSKEYQQVLWDRDVAEHGGRPSGEVARPGHSPHETGAAMDLAIPANMDAKSFADLLRRRSVDLKFPMARTGWKLYGGRFCHVDLVHMIFEPYLKGRPNPNPGAWSPGVKW